MNEVSGMSNAMESYVDYIENALSKFEKETSLINEMRLEVTPQALNRALAEYTRIGIDIAGEQTRQEMQLEDAERDYEVWWDGLFLEAREKLLDGKSNSYVLSVEVIKSTVRSQNAEEYKRRASEISKIKHVVSFLGRTSDRWKKHGDILVALGNNMRQEVRSLSIDNRVNAVQPVRTEFPQQQQQDRPTRPMPQPSF